MRVDIASDTWREIKKRCERKIGEALDLVASPYCAERAADQARGEIAAYRDILALAEPKAVELSGDYSKRTDRSGI